MDISEFVARGLKNYAFKVKTKKTNSETTDCKVKGITMNFQNSELINFDSIKIIITSQQIGEKEEEKIILKK